VWTGDAFGVARNSGAPAICTLSSHRQSVNDHFDGVLYVLDSFLRDGTRVRTRSCWTVGLFRFDWNQMSRWHSYAGMRLARPSRAMLRWSRMRWRWDCQNYPVWSKYSTVLKPRVMAVPAQNRLEQTSHANSGPCNVVLRPFRMCSLDKPLSRQPLLDSNRSSSLTTRDAERRTP
jgi:hypothetical protein